MSTGGSNRAEMKRIVICCRGKLGTKSTIPRNKCCPGRCCFRISRATRRRWEPSPIRFLKKLRDKAVTALCMVSLGSKASPKISSLEKPTPSAASSDSHRSESVEACIQYLNSSSSSQSESNPNTAVSRSK